MSASSYLSPDGLSLARRYSEEEGYSLSFLQSRMRHKEATRARQSVIWRLAKDTCLTLPELAALMKKDHTSVLHAIRAENDRRRSNVRGMQFPEGYRERHRITANICNQLSREVLV